MIGVRAMLLLSINDSGDYLTAARRVQGSDCGSLDRSIRARLAAPDDY